MAKIIRLKVRDAAGHANVSIALGCLRVAEGNFFLARLYNFSTGVQCGKPGRQ
jgi:hypothetical protein